MGAPVVKLVYVCVCALSFLRCALLVVKKYHDHILFLILISILYNGKMTFLSLLYDRIAPSAQDFLLSHIYMKRNICYTHHIDNIYVGSTLNIWFTKNTSALV